MNRRMMIAGSVVLLGSLGAANRAKASCLPLSPDWSGVILVNEGGTMNVRAQGTLHTGGPAITTETRFNILSLGKMMTGVLMGQLVDAGQVRYSDLVSVHLPDLPSRIGDLRVGDLLTHSSGLGDYIEVENFGAIAAALSATDLLPLVLAAPYEAPGAPSYSNSGYAVAGALIERITGQTYRDRLSEQVFGPCGMASASLQPRVDDALAEPAYEALRSGRPSVGTLPGGPAGGAFMKAGDMALFAQALFSGRLVSDVTRDVITSIQAERQPLAADGIRRGWGFGFGVRGDGVERSIGHTGGLPGFSAACRIQPSQGRIVVALANQDRVGAAEVSSAVMANPELCKT
ncbi:serine hydrolase domain-containing protein [Brevundimonas sp.]|uniref:serine hydrolase domain-containing protein n=1 Tax=Brevundimonas sp. TaxID=1871086 RepID=UPI0026357C92|nr:serine hydrolase domain-containing protein [Brevundimonas sp.]